MGLYYISGWRRGAALLCLAIVLSGCASVGTAPGHSLLDQEKIEPKKGWWYTRFYIKWTEDSEPSWHIDMLLAQKVISPVLYRYKNDLTLWRFHRRAVLDPSGHKFSFIFYSSPEMADKIYSAIQSDSLLKELEENGNILHVGYDDTSTITRPNIEDTSDAKWSSPVKKAWPHYIMGASQMWLNLIAEISEETSTENIPSSLKEQLIFYEQIRESIKTTWQTEGQHAFLHHINALFGYDPVLITKRDLQFF